MQLLLLGRPHQRHHAPNFARFAPSGRLRKAFAKSRLRDVPKCYVPVAHNSTSAPPNLHGRARSTTGKHRKLARCVGGKRVGNPVTNVFSRAVCCGVACARHLNAMVGASTCACELTKRRPTPFSAIPHRATIRTPRRPHARRARCQRRAAQFLKYARQGKASSPAHCIATTTQPETQQQRLRCNHTENKPQNLTETWIHRTGQTHTIDEGGAPVFKTFGGSEAQNKVAMTSPTENASWGGAKDKTLGGRTSRGPGHRSDLRFYSPH